MINFKNITVGYSSKIILDNININIPKGKITTLLGPNGSGKTTLMSTLNGLIKPMSGEIYVDNKNLINMKPKERAKLIATVPQFHSPKFDYTVFDIVLSGRAPHVKYTPTKIDKEKALNAIKEVGIENLTHKEYTRISGGERQLVMIARAITQESPIIVLDEPTSYLDLKNQIRVLNLIKRINEESGITCIMTLHEPNYALTFSHQIALVYNKKVKLGSPSDIITKDIINKIYEVDCELIEHNNYKYILPKY